MENKMTKDRVSKYGKELCLYFQKSNRIIDVFVYLMVILICYSCNSLKQASTNKQDSYSFYPILAYNHTNNTHVPLKDMASSGINIVGFIRPSNLAMLKNTGLKAIVMPEEMPAGQFVKRGKGSGGGKLKTVEVNNRSSWKAIHSFYWNDLSDDRVDSIIKNYVESSADNENVLGYFLSDEPSSLEFPTLGKAVEAIKKYAPGKLAYINLFPNYASTQKTGESRVESQLGTKTYREYLERYVNEAHPQFISYDNYEVQYSQNLKNKDRAKLYFNNLLIVRQVAIENKLPYWSIMASCRLRPNYAIPTLENMRLQAYAALAAGYDGISWYQYGPNSYSYNPIDKAGKKTEVWGYLKKVNHVILTLGPIIKTLKSTGVYFTSNASQDIAPVLPGEVVQSIQSGEPMMMGEFESDEGVRYAMLVNLNLQGAVKFTFSTTKAVTAVWAISFSADNGSEVRKKAIPEIKDKEGQDIHGNRIWGDLTLQAGEGILIQIER